MKLKKHSSDEKRSFVLRWVSIGCFIAAAVFIFITYLMTLPEVQKSLADIQDWFTKVEIYIAGFNKWIVLAIILALFFTKGFIPLFPLSVLFITTGLVYPAGIAALINILGFGMLVSIKYFWGRRFGGGNSHKLLIRSDTINKFMKLGGDGNKWMLVLLRFIPFVPIGTVSRVYGATEIDYLPFVSLSVLGFLPRLISWSIIGCNITNPFTASFTAPIVTLLIISGISLLILNTLLNLVKKDNPERTNDKQ